METCVLIPQEFSLAMTAAGARNSGEQSVSVWSSTRIKQGELYYPFQGTVRIDKLNIYSYVENEDVSTIVTFYLSPPNNPYFITITQSVERIFLRISSHAFIE